MRLLKLDFLRSWREVSRFTALPEAERALVFYAESHASWVHFAPIVEHLTGALDRRVAYVTSSREDPILTTDNARIRPFFIGEGAACTYWFMNLRAGVAVLTMPDLESFHKKRSRVAPVHYAYVFHSMVSTHMIYRPGAFDHYDTLFAVGPHHLAELRAAEAAAGLEPRRIVEHGYGRLDTLLAAAPEPSKLAPPQGNTPPRVLVAPSWGPEGLLESRGEALVEGLLAAGCQVIVRPHPETGKRWPQTLERLERFRRDECFELETDIASQDSLLTSHLMVSDWSGAALEYAFGLERPVLFIDVERKINNPAYDELGIEPLEVAIRAQIGEVLPPDRLDEIGAAIGRLVAAPEAWRDRIRAARERTVFHVGRSGAVAAEELARLADERSAAGTAA